MKINLIEKINWTFQIDFPSQEEDILQCDESMEETSSKEKRRRIINSLSTVKDAVDLCIEHGGFGSKLPKDFMPYWKMMCDDIDNLRKDDNKKKGYK